MVTGTLYFNTTQTAPLNEGVELNFKSNNRVQLLGCHEEISKEALIHILVQVIEELKE